MPMSNISPAVAGSTETYSSSLGAVVPTLANPTRTPVAVFDLGELVELLGEPRTEAAEAERVGAHDVVAGELLLEDVADPVLERRRHDGDRGDERDAHHQRAAGAGGALRVAQRVLPRQSPVMPDSAGSGAPAPLTTGRAMTGPSTNTPMKIASAPRPTHCDAQPGEPGHDGAGAEDRERGAVGEAPTGLGDATGRPTSRSAASGGIREARNDGNTADTTVTTRPDDERDDRRPS